MFKKNYLLGMCSLVSELLFLVASWYVLIIYEEGVIIKKDILPVITRFVLDYKLFAFSGILLAIVLTFLSMIKREGEDGEITLLRFALICLITNSFLLVFSLAFPYFPIYLRNFGYIAGCILV